MRIVSQNFQYQPNNLANPCDTNTAWFGETEDYTIIVSGSVATPVNYLWSDGQTNPTQQIFLPEYILYLLQMNGCWLTILLLFLKLS